ncbi:MAG TPA: glycerophosphodiester phosphodiesterase family protein [Clostridia bacterium]|nr:glycerophosphodiester phosphodiesterase family protein [Clostridia bacterium]
MKKKYIIMLAVLLCIALAWTTIAVIPRKAATETNAFVIEQNSRPLLIAHGGGNREFPDNTLEACYNAYSVDENVMLEMDVSITKDGVVIMSHDTTLDYRTNASGKISDWNYTDLLTQRVDFSYLNKKADGVVVEVIKYTDYLGREVTPLDVSYPEGVSARDPEVFLVTTLDEVLTCFPNNTVNVEIKQSGEIGITALHAVIDVLEEHDAFDRVVLASFHKEIYEEMKLIKANEHPEIMCSPETAGVAEILVTGWFGLDLFYDEPVTVLQVPMKESFINVATKNFVNTAHRHNIAVHYWTIDDEDDMRYLVSIGADGIMTNIPHLLKQVYDDMFD